MEDSRSAICHKWWPITHVLPFQLHLFVSCFSDLYILFLSPSSSSSLLLGLFIIILVFLPLVPHLLLVLSAPPLLSSASSSSISILLLPAVPPSSAFLLSTLFFSFSFSLLLLILFRSASSLSDCAAWLEVSDWFQTSPNPCGRWKDITEPIGFPVTCNDPLRGASLSQSPKTISIPSVSTSISIPCSVHAYCCSKIYPGISNFTHLCNMYIYVYM